MSNKRIEVTCKYCGKTFIAKSLKAKYCSVKCHDIVYRQKNGIKCNPNVEPYHKICKVCGKPFDSFREASVTCSSECANNYHKGRSSKDTIKKICVICGASYLCKDSRCKTCGNEKCRREHNKIQYKKRYERAKAIKPKHIIKIVKRKCVICGKRFDVDYRLNTKTCSKECSLENERKHRNRRHDKRIPKEQRVDKITLKKLYRRDKGKCYLCGGVCNWDDWQTAPSGNKYPGDTYPTIEHVVPISRGGLDAWDNVRLACWKCNIEKSNFMLLFKPMTKEYAYSEKRLGTQPKKTAQYSLDGKLIKIWDSTADIRRELGLNDKHIQSVCRRYKSNTGNAYGYHWEYIEEQNDKCG